MTQVAQTRGRGRPLGSTRYTEEDTAILRKVADYVVTNAASSIAVAIRQSIGSAVGESRIHRLRAKWKAQKAELLAAAQERRRQTALSNARRTPYGMYSDLMRQIDAMQRLRQSLPSMDMARQLSAIQGYPGMQSFMAMQGRLADVMKAAYPLLHSGSAAAAAMAHMSDATRLAASGLSVEKFMARQYPMIGVGRIASSEGSDRVEQIVRSISDEISATMKRKEG